VAWFKRGTVLEYLQQHQQAVISFDRVVQLQPDNYWAWHERGKILETMRCQEEAIASYDKALQIKPDLQSALEGRKRLLGQGHPEQEQPGQSDLEQVNPWQPSPISPVGHPETSGVQWRAIANESLDESNQFGLTPALTSLNNSNNGFWGQA
jgi:tetratricopeptide (TPR) repeat protein